MTDGQSAPTAVSYPRRLVRNHGFPAHRVRQLILDALTPLPTDPIPKSILITEIKVTQVDVNNLEITCEVYYETE